MIETNKAPKALGPYSQAIEYDGLIYTSGQIAIDQATGKMVDGDFAARVHQVMHNLAAVLEAGGSDFTKVIKSTIFVTDLSNFTVLNEIYGGYVSASKPARATVQVAALPLGTDVEIEMIAHK